jgi:hypothetical protein
MVTNAAIATMGFSKNEASPFLGGVAHFERASRNYPEKFF